MFKFCPQCGNNLKEDFKFCPSCGYQLNKVSESLNEEVLNSGNQTSRIIICENCGEENSEENNSCSNCGVKLKGEIGEKIVKSSAKVRRTHKKQTISQSKTFSGNKQSAINIPVKQLELKKILTIVSGIAAAGLIILILSGVFDKPDSQVNNQTPNTGQNQSSGVDLSSLQRINELEEKVKQNPSDKESLLQLAHLRNDSGFYEQAITNYKEYLDKVPNNSDARVDMGVCYYNLGRYDDAIREMTIALENKPDHQIAHLNLGIVNLAAGNLEKSKEWLRKAVALNPNSEIGKKAQELLQSH